MSNVDQTFLCITFGDDTVGIMGFVTEERHDGVVWWTRLATRAAVSAEIARTGFDRHKLPIKGWRFIEYADIPQDRTYRNALRWDEGFYHDMPHARNLHRDYLRRARAKAMPLLDVAYLQALEANEVEQRALVCARKQVLRDLPTHPGIEMAETTDELKQVWPIELVLAEITLPTLEEILA